ncbi:longitudinals lacking protein, isoforms H/M/V isoform X8 [Drosophila yakuba]|uniref:Uncharacterized protein, isoform N n=1 Tax=Drosophila yakuba TaxID=7245 RepID=A0A0R1DVX3_DROYA|nr:longitudinals lacking protein, isoforms H/M/V isoform X8 [Drosophila yakuba]KRJ98927.1 uncharacterized protein Dyak_GE13086, isoform N [Drosophila yakuba]KRJ98934.1 uncharacterized protein Dyak_GE13086, isoform U [Drosophila yakuba]
MDDDQQFCLRWNNHQSTLISVFDTLLENETLVDCTLAAEGKFLKAHKVVLSACSPYFATLLQEQYDKHPIFILKDVKYQELRAMMDYMYRGEVNISQDQLAALLKAAESLQIKGLSDNRTGGGAAPKPESSGHHRGGKLSGAYTLEQTKRARLATGGAMDTSGDVSGSREGSSSPSRRRRKVRRRSMENDAHDNSNSSVLQAAASNQSILQQTGAGLAVSALVSTQLSSGPAAGTSSQASSTQQQQPLTSTNVTKKTESAKLTSSTAAPASGASASAAAVQQAHLHQHQQQAQTTSDAINTDNVQAQSQGGAQGVQGDDEDIDEGSAVGGSNAASGPNPASASAVHAGVVVKQLASVVDKSSSNHKHKIKDNSVSSVGSEMVIEPKAEYDDDAHDENVEDLTLDEEDMTMEELDQTAGTSQGGEGSSQTYATWQHDRSQDELGLMAQDAQQRDPQGLQLIDDSSSSQQNHLNGSKLELMDGSSDDYHQGSGSLHHFHAPQFDHFQGLLAGGNGIGGGAGSGGQEESFTCPQCYRTYRRHGTLRRHLRQECGKGKSMVCSVCGHRTKRADHLRQHVRKKHPEIAMRSLFKRQQRAAAAAASAAEGEDQKPETEIVDLVDMLDDGSVAAADEDHQHAYLVEDDDEEELLQHQQSHLTEESTTSNYYRQQLRQQALLQQALQQVAAAAAVVASGTSTSSPELLNGEGL